MQNLPPSPRTSYADLPQHERDDLTAALDDFNRLAAALENARREYRRLKVEPSGDDQAANYNRCVLGPLSTAIHNAEGRLLTWIQGHHARAVILPSGRLVIDATRRVTGREPGSLSLILNPSEVMR